MCSAYTIVDDLFWLIDLGYTTDGKLSIEECAKIALWYEIWKSNAQSPELTP